MPAPLLLHKAHQQRRAQARLSRSTSLPVWQLHAHQRHTLAHWMHTATGCHPKHDSLLTNPIHPTCSHPQRNSTLLCRKPRSLITPWLNHACSATGPGATTAVVAVHVLGNSAAQLSCLLLCGSATASMVVHVQGNTLSAAAQFFLSLTSTPFPPAMMQTSTMSRNRPWSTTPSRSRMALLAAWESLMGV